MKIREILDLGSNRLAEDSTQPQQSPLSPSEVSVLERIVAQQRAFTGTTAIMVCHRLADRGLITMQVGKAASPDARSIFVNDEMTGMCALVQAPDIDSAIARHGKQAVLSSLRKIGQGRG